MASTAKNQEPPVSPTHLDRNDRKALEAISTASITPADAYFLVRGLLHRDVGSEVMDTAYEALRSLVFHFIASRTTGERLDLWADAILRMKQLFRAKDELAAERLTVLADLLGQASRFAEALPTDELHRRKHVRALLQILANNEGAVERSRIAEATKLRPANLSRILTNLESLGWIIRQQSGREVLVSITPEGRIKGLKEHGTAVSGSGPFENANAVQILRNLWARTGASIAMSAPGVGFVSCDSKFAQLLGFNDPSEVIGQSNDIVRQRLAEMTTGTDEIAPDEIILADGSCIRVVEQTSNEASLWLGFDITPYKRRVDAYERRERVILEEIDVLRRSTLRQPEASVPAFYGNKGLWHSEETSGSHDLATYLSWIRQDLLFPLTAINNAAHQMKIWLPRTSSDSDQLLEQIEFVTAQSERVRNSIRDLVYMGGATPGFTVSSFQPSEIIHDVTKDLSYTCRAYDQSFEFPSLLQGPVETDEMLFRSTIRCAIAGVMNMTPTGGKIAIEARQVDDTVLFVVKARITKGTGRWTNPAHLNLNRQAVARIGGQCEFETSKTQIVARISLPVMVRSTT